MNLAMTMRWPALLALAAALSACTSVPSRGPAPPEPVAQVSAAARQAEAQRRAWLQARSAWEFQGRLAVSSGRDGGSGHIDWHQQGAAYTVQLSAPVTRQSWTLSDAGDGVARIDGLPAGPRAGSDARSLLREAGGWDIPVERLADWVRGLPGAGAEQVGYDAEGRLRRLAWQGWTLEYLEWTPAQDDRPALPRRIEAGNGTARVRLVVDDWEFAAP